MGNSLSGNTYVKGSARNIQPKIAKIVDSYKSRLQISTSSNIHTAMSVNIHKGSEHRGRKVQ
jgi:hypothetical protein